MPSGSTHACETATQAREPRPVLLVVTSTYPRWHNDAEPGFVHELAKRLASRFHVIVLGPHAPGARHDEILDGVEVIRYRYAPERFETLVNNGGILTNLRRRRWKLLLLPGFVVSQAWNIRRILRARQVSVVHAHWLLPQGIVCAMLRAMSQRVPPFVATSHGSDLLALKGPAAKFLRNFVIRQAAAITVVSTGMRDKLAADGADVSKVRVQPMGVDLTGRFRPSDGCARRDREILFVGRLVAGKGLDVLLAAMRIVAASIPDAVLRIVGGGPLAESLSQQAVDSGIATRVRFTGAISNVELPEIYRSAGVFVAPFTDEQGFGLTLVEAAGCGCKLVVSDIPSCREIVVTLGQGFLVPPGDSEALADAILAALRAPEPASTEEQRASLMRFDWNDVAWRYGNLLASCAGATRTSRVPQ